MNSPATPVLSRHAWSRLRTELVWIYDHAPAPHARRGTFDHREGNWAWYLRKGEVTVATQNGPLVARAGQWLFPPAELHRHDFSDDARLVSVRFLCHWPSGENLLAPHPGLVLDGGAHPELLKTARALARVARPPAGGSHHDQARLPCTYPDFVRFQAAFLDWLDVWFQACLAAGVPPARQAGDERALRAMHILEAAPLDRAFPRAAMLKACGLGVMQLKRLFQQEFDLTPHQYWERRRLESARHCLEAGQLPVKSIAARLGFRGHAHFTVWFKRRTGLSPRLHRAREAHV